MRSTNRARRGFTLAESLTASVVLATAVTAIAGALYASSSQSRSQEQSDQALQLAADLMETVSSKPLRNTNDIDDSSTSTMVGWQRYMDAHHVTDASISEIVKSQNRNLDEVDHFMLGMNGFTDEDGNSGSSALYVRRVEIEYRDAPTGSATNVKSDFALVTITVTPPNGESVVLQQLVSKTESPEDADDDD